ncbi:hypothetical protein MKR65_15530 [Acinetobacter baumannii]
MVNQIKNKGITKYSENFKIFGINFKILGLIMGVLREKEFWRLFMVFFVLHLKGLAQSQQRKDQIQYITLIDFI